MVELAAAVAHVIDRRFPHLTTVLRDVTTTGEGRSLTVPFPAYIVH